MWKVSRFVIAVGGNWMNECHVYRRQMLWSHLKHCSGSHALSEMQQSVGVQTTWGVHLPDQRWSILRYDKGTECELWTQKGSSSLAVIIKKFYEDSFVMTHAWPCLCYSHHSASALREIDNTTDLQRWGGAYGWPGSILWLIIIAFKCYKLFASKFKWMETNHLKEAAQGFIQYHLNALNLLRKHVWRGKKQSCQETFR